jgi:hypothetical protein
MKRFWLNLWMDDCGALLATEWIVLATIIVLGVVPGLIAIRNGLLHEMKDIANATMSLDQSYEFTGNELMFDDYRPRDTANRWLTTDGGSLTEIVKDANNQHSRTTTVARFDGRNPRDPRWQQPRIARTAGSAFIQGNHTFDGREVHSTVKQVETRPVEVETAEVVAAKGHD